MANYPLIFGISLVINVAVTFRSSDKFKLYCGSSPRNQEDPHNKHEDEPLLEKGASASDAGDGGKATEKARHAALLRRYFGCVSAGGPQRLAPGTVCVSFSFASLPN